MSAEVTFVRRRLDSIAQVGGGLALGRSVSEGASVELPYLRVANVQDGHIDTSDMKTVRVLPAEVERYRVREGDLLLTEGGDFDKLGRGAVWDGRFPICLHQNHVFRLRANRKFVLPEYLSLYMASWRGRQYFLNVAKQTTNLATISSSQLKAMPIEVPDLKDQRRIVEILNSVRELEKASEGLILKLRTLRRSAVATALPREGKQGYLQDVRWVPVAEAGSVRMGKQLSPDSQRSVVQYPYLRVANVLAGRIDYSDVKTMGFSGRELCVYGLEPGDILLNEGQSLELVGRSAIYEEKSGEFFFQNTLLRFRSSGEVLPRYAQAVFSSWLESGKFAEIAKKTTSIAHLGGERFGALRFPVISISDQRRIIDILQAWDVKISDEERALKKLNDLKRGLVQDLLAGKRA
ncbi:restriction endonuclease subunit S [Streptomyces sp. CG4]|uniref:restriction endonuclease subunit S n=1 Tax=Streptomyces sp. CG4 TaxID=408783 RepID=UPI0034E1C940